MTKHRIGRTGSLPVCALRNNVHVRPISAIGRSCERRLALHWSWNTGSIEFARNKQSMHTFCCAIRPLSGTSSLPCEAIAECGIAKASFVRLSVYVNVEVSYRPRLEFCENNFTDDWPNYFTSGSGSGLTTMQ